MSTHLSTGISMEGPEYLYRALKRERAARALAESLLEEKTRNLYLTNEALLKQYSVVKQHAKKVDLFLSIIQMSHEDLTFEDQLQRFISFVCEMSGWPIGHVYLPDELNENQIKPSLIWHFQDKIYTHFKEVTDNTILKKGEGLSGRVYKTGKPVWIADVRIDTNFTRKKAALYSDLKGAFSIPVIIEGKVAAISEFFFNHIAEEDIYLLQIVEAAAQQLALLIEKQQKELDHQKSLESINKQLIAAARQAGMAEIATSVLHNIGNIMNSVNIAAQTMNEHLHSVEFKSLTEAVKLINENQGDYNSFFNNNQGQNVLEFMSRLPEIWDDHKKKFKEELVEIFNKIEHIKEVIASQQSLTNVMGLIEDIKLIDLLEEALRLSKSTFPNVNVDIVKDFSIQPTISTDKSKLLHILVNLVRNAYESILESGSQNKDIIVQVTSFNKLQFCIKIVDHGKGIAPENLKKIFSYGFTTKKNGHGIGLHASANAAKELGGSLTAESPGYQQGAVFKLILPLKSRSKSNQRS